MERRNFLLNLLLWILASFFGYTIKKEGENLNLSKTDARMVLDRDGKNISDKIGYLNEQLADIAKLSINALNPPIPLVAAKFDGTNDTPALQALVDYLVGKGGGKIVLPPLTSKCNIVLTGNNVTVEGAGNATVLQPYDLTKPVIALGNGVAQTYNTTLKGMRLVGDALTTTSDGLVIDGVTYLKVDDFVVLTFGRDNIRITSTGSEPTQYISFTSLSSKRALGSCLKMNYGTTWVTSTYFTGTYLEGRNTKSATALDLTGIVMPAFANSYIQAGGHKQGHVVFNTDGAKLKGQNLNIDCDDSNFTIVEIKSIKSIVNSYLDGTIIVNGKIGYSDLSTADGRNIGDILKYHSILSYPVATSGIIFSDVTKGEDARVNATENNSGVLLNSAGVLYQYANGLASPAGAILNGTGGTPSSSTATGLTGQVMWDANYLYVCIATNSWIRVAKDTVW